MAHNNGEYHVVQLSSEAHLRFVFDLAIGEGWNYSYENLQLYKKAYPDALWIGQIQTSGQVSSLSRSSQL